MFDDVEELDFAGPWEVFGAASRFKQDLQVSAVSKDGKLVRCRYGLKVQPDYSFTNCPQLDLLIVPGGRGAREKARFDKEIIAFIQRHSSLAETASVCTGAVILAEAGILSGKRATTHASGLHLLREYPNVQVVENERFVFDETIATSAGVSAGIDLSLELLRRHFGENLVRDVVKVMEYRY